MPYFDANPGETQRRRMAALGFARLAGPLASPLRGAIGDITTDLQSVDWGTVGLIGIGILLFVGVARRGSSAKLRNTKRESKRSRRRADALFPSFHGQSHRVSSLEFRDADQRPAPERNTPRGTWTWEPGHKHSRRPSRIGTAASPEHHSIFAASSG